MILKVIDGVKSVVSALNSLDLSSAEMMTIQQSPFPKIRIGILNSQDVLFLTTLVCLTSYNFPPPPPTPSSPPLFIFSS